MLVIGIRLVGGKFHATPWGRFPNEGVVEWPPSPYRLLRALVSSWKIAHPRVGEDDVSALLKKLAMRPPSFCLPPASVGHTRHYMPPHSGNTNLIMDTFVLVDRASPVRIVWPDLILDPDEMNLLRDLLNGLHYFGRSESWCETFVECDGDAMDNGNCKPYEAGAGMRGNDMELVQVLVPTASVSIAHLVETTSSLRKRGRLQPGGSEVRQYLRDPIVRNPVLSAPAEPKRSNEVVRYAVVDKVKPLVTESLIIADTMRRAAMSMFGNANGGAKSPVLSGKDESGTILKGHMHASYLPTDEDGDGRIDHMTVVAGEIDSSPKKELDALSSVNHLWSASLKGNIRLVFEGHGKIVDFPNVKMFGTSRRWQTATPLVLSRHMKLRKSEGRTIVKDSASAQIRKELSLRYGIGQVKIEYTNPREPMPGSGLAPRTSSDSAIKHGDSRKSVTGPRFRPFEFKRLRKNDKPGGGAYGLFLEFEQPVRGPLCLGYASHFGLGLFVPDTE